MSVRFSCVFPFMEEGRSKTRYLSKWIVLSLPTHMEGKKMEGGGGCGGGMDGSYRKLLHTNARCAAVTPLRSVTMRSFVPEIGMNKNTYPHTHTCTHTCGSVALLTGS